MQRLITPISQEAFTNEFLAIKLAEEQTTAGKIHNTEAASNNPRKDKFKEYAKNMAILGGAFVAGHGLAEGVSRLIPKNNPTVGTALKSTLPFVGIAGVEAVRQYRKALDDKKK